MKKITTVKRAGCIAMGLLVASPVVSWAALRSASAEESLADFEQKVNQQIEGIDAHKREAFAKLEEEAQNDRERISERLRMEKEAVAASAERKKEQLAASLRQKREKLQSKVRGEKQAGSEG